MEHESRFEDQDELRLFAYRMSGSLAFADRMSEEVVLTVGGAPGPADGPGREVLLRVAAGLCMNALRGKEARSLPSWADGLGGGPSAWLEPFPDDLVPETALSPSRYEPRESVSLEFVGALQVLRPASRAGLLLSDVLGLEENGDGSGLADLEEARVALEGVYRRQEGRRMPPAEGDATELMMRYIYNWETADAGGLGAMLSDGAVYQAPPTDDWFEGKSAVVGYLEEGPLAGEREHWRLLPTRANGQLAFGAYELDAWRRTYRAHSIHITYFSGRAVSEIIAFGGPQLFKLFQLPDEVVAQGKTGM